MLKHVYPPITLKQRTTTFNKFDKVAMSGEQ